jgi:hypothetical protein
LVILAASFLVVLLASVVQAFEPFAQSLAHAACSLVKADHLREFGDAIRGTRPALDGAPLPAFRCDRAACRCEKFKVALRDQARFDQIS